MLSVYSCAILLIAGGCELRSAPCKSVGSDEGVDTVAGRWPSSASCEPDLAILYGTNPNVPAIFVCRCCNKVTLDSSDAGAGSWIVNRAEVDFWIARAKTLIAMQDDHEGYPLSSTTFVRLGKNYEISGREPEFFVAFTKSDRDFISQFWESVLATRP
jgi:hypothetical protein